MNIFIEDTDVIKIPVCICGSKTSKSAIYIAASKESLEKEKDIDQNDINYDDMQLNNVYFRFPNYNDSMKIMEDSVHSNGEEVDINVSAARRAKLTLLLKDWDFKDKDGNKIEPKIENIYKLHPAVANFLSSKLDEVV